MTRIEPTVDQIEDAVTQVINGVARGFDSTAYIEWLCTSGDMREASKDFGQISTDELLMLLAHPETDAVTCKQIGAEIRRRFTDHFLEGITALAEKIAAADAEYWATERAIDAYESRVAA